MSMLKVIEVLAESDKSWEDAAQQAVTKTAKTVHNVKSIYIKNFEATVDNGKLKKYASTPRSRSCSTEVAATVQGPRLIA